jgi:hypothetical protein
MVELDAAGAFRVLDVLDSGNQRMQCSKKPSSLPFARQH